MLAVKIKQFLFHSLNCNIHFLLVRYAHRFRSSLNYTAVLNLNCSLVFSFKSFYTCFLSLKKHQKRPAPAKM